MKLFLCALCFVATVTVQAEVHPWPDFRGPSADGVSVAVSAPSTVAEVSENLLWKVALVGRGWSTPVVTDDGKIWITAAEETFSDTIQKQAEVAAVLLRAIEIDFETGEVLRTVDLAHVEKPEPIHKLNLLSLWWARHILS